MKQPNIIYEDEQMLVVDKPAGLSVHEGSGQTEATLTDWLAKHLPRSPLKTEHYGLVHRLDKDTSGVLLVAKTRDSFTYLRNLFRLRQIHKEYLALLHGRLTPKRGVIQIPLGRDLVHRTRVSPSSSGKVAETRYEVIRYLPGLTYVRALPATGRTHQIRVHFSGLGYPLVGDKTYGRKDDLPRQFLHAHKVSFVDLQGHRRTFASPLPADLTHYLNGPH